jgi:hypothetical protein
MTAHRSSAAATSSPAATSGVDMCLRAVSMASRCAAAHTPAAATSKACMDMRMWHDCCMAQMD